MKSLPQRMCVGCREMKSKRALIRVVRSPEGALSLDATGKKPGRGAYICPEEACFKQALKSRGLERALKVKIKEELWDEIQEQINLEEA